MCIFWNLIFVFRCNYGWVSAWSPTCQDAYCILRKQLFKWNIKYNRYVKLTSRLHLVLFDGIIAGISRHYLNHWHTPSFLSNVVSPTMFRATKWGSKSCRWFEITICSHWWWPFNTIECVSRLQTEYGRSTGN